MAGDDARMVCLGIVTAAHGVRGEVRIHTFTDRPEGLVAYGDLYDESGTRRFAVCPGGSVRGAVIARIGGVDDRNAAERLRGCKLCVPRSALPETDPDEYYHTDLVGLRAEVVNGADGLERSPLGAVTAVDDFGAGPVLEIAVAGGPPVMVPFTRAVVPWVDLEAGRIGIAAIPGLLGGSGPEETPPPVRAEHDR